MFWVSGFVSVVAQNAAVFSGMVFFGLSLLVFRGCVKVLSVLGWFIMISLGGSNWVTQTSWSGIRSVCSNSTNTVVSRKDRVLWLLVLERVVIGQFFGT